ncbi:MAG: cell division protein FtsZ [Bacteroidales bacterium]|nr:cell division protein FtsZ [Bacteroidales bacterium]
MENIIPTDWSETGNLIKVIGVGGGGTNAVNYMYRQKVEHVDYVVCNTDKQHLNYSEVPTKIQLGVILTKGLGAGTDSLQGTKAAQESVEEIRKMLSGNNQMAFVACGMGGGTGTGAAPVIAGEAKAKDLLTIGVVTLPFRDEGEDSLYRATEGIKEMSKNVDSLLVIDNNRLYDVYPDLKLKDALNKADEVLATAVRSITEIITCNGYINVDFADVRKIMKDSGMAYMGIGEASGADRVQKAVDNALNSPLLANCDIKKASKVLVHICTGTDENSLGSAELNRIMEYIQEATGGTDATKRGVVFDDSLGDNIRITIVATGYDLTSLPVPNQEKVNRGKVIMVELDEIENPKSGLPIYSGENISVSKRQRYLGKPSLIVSSPEQIPELEAETAYTRRGKLMIAQQRNQLQKSQHENNQTIQSE